MGNKDDTDAALRFHLLQQVLYGLSYIYHFIFFLCSDGDRFQLVSLFVMLIFAYQACASAGLRGQLCQTRVQLVPMLVFRS